MNLRYVAAWIWPSSKSPARMVLRSGMWIIVAYAPAMRVLGRLSRPQPTRRVDVTRGVHEVS